MYTYLSGYWKLHICFGYNNVGYMKSFKYFKFVCLKKNSGGGGGFGIVFCSTDLQIGR